MSTFVTYNQQNLCLYPSKRNVSKNFSMSNHRRFKHYLHHFTFVVPKFKMFYIQSHISHNLETPIKGYKTVFTTVCFDSCQFFSKPRSKKREKISEFIKLIIKNPRSSFSPYRVLQLIIVLLSFFSLLS